MDNQEISSKTPSKVGVSQEPNPVEYAVARALRENLERVQRNSNELNQALSDLVAACASSKPTNALPPLLRAQTAAASLSATLEVLSRFVAATLQSALRNPPDAEASRVVTLPMPEPSQQPERPIPPLPTPMAGRPASARAEFVIEEEPVLEVIEEPAPAAVPAKRAPFDLQRLSPEEQELHRRANRVAKVSMQDIKMLRPEQVRLGRENKDLCIRLRDDIEKAHREYDRRFRSILHHPVDYFYHWMVQILADGDPKALGQYPYATTSRHS